MVQINLLPPTLKRKKEKQVMELQILPGLFFLVGVAVVLSLIWVLLSFNLRGQQSRLSELNQRWSEIEQDIRRLKAAEVEKANLEKRAQFINQIIGREISWSEFLNRLSDALPDGVWLVSVSLKSRPGASRELKIIGRAISLGNEEMVELIEKFVKNLGEADVISNNFTEMKLGALNRIKVGKWDTMKFEISSRMF
jgi:Tfp pilus assembly protein PilN